MPEGGVREGAGGEERVWGQRCSLYIYRAKAKSWVKVGTGKGTLVRITSSGKAEFRFEDNMQIPMAKHLVETISELQQNTGTAKGCSWTTSADAIHPKGQQWFTAKFAATSAAESFKDALEALMQNSQASIAPPLAGELSPLLNARPPSPDGEQPQAAQAQRDALDGGFSRQTSSDSRSTDKASKASTSLAQLALAPAPSAFRGRAGSRSPSPLPVSPVFGAIGDRLSMEPWSPSWATGRPRVAPLESWLVYFERSLVRNAMRETSTVYVGAYDTKERALVMCVRAMDAHCDRREPWRVRSCWDQVEDRRASVGDQGVVISVRHATGAFYRVWVCRMGFNKELPESDYPDGDNLWGGEE